MKWKSEKSGKNFRSKSFFHFFHFFAHRESGSDSDSEQAKVGWLVYTYVTQPGRCVANDVTLVKLRHVQPLLRYLAN